MGDFAVGNKLQCCEGWWTCESGEKKSAIDYMVFGKGLDVVTMVEDSGNVDVGSGHSLIWGKVTWGSMEVEVRRERYKWRVDGIWKEYQNAVEEDFIGWEVKLVKRRKEV